MGLTAAQVAILNRQGRETRAAEERAEQVELERFERTKLELSRQKERMKVEMDRLKLSEDLAKLRAATQIRGQDISERTAAAGRAATKPHQAALTAESRARTRKLDSLLSELRIGTPLEREFDERIKELIRAGDLSPDPEEFEGILQSIARQKAVAGWGYRAVNDLLAKHGFETIPTPNASSVIEITQDMLDRIRAGNSN